MNKLLAICGLVMLGTTTTPQAQDSASATDAQEVVVPASLKEVNRTLVLTATAESLATAPKLVSKVKKQAPEEFNINDIVYIEEECPEDLGFDTADYLPENFDPFEVYFDVNSLTFIEEEEPLEVNTMDYLPVGFDPYALPGDPMKVSFIDEDPEIVLGFDTAAYLPVGFDPYARPLDLSTVEYIEVEEEIEFDFDTRTYLPGGFDPHSR